MILSVAAAKGTEVKKKICKIEGNIIQSRKEEVLPLPCIQICWELYSQNFKKLRRNGKHLEVWGGQPQTGWRCKDPL